MDDEPAEAIQQAAEVEERAGDVDLGDIDVPVLLGTQGLLEAPPLELGLVMPRPDRPGLEQDAVDARWAGGDDVGIEHHEGAPSVTLQGVGLVELEDGRILPRFEPTVARDQGVVLVGQAVVCPPVVELLVLALELVAQRYDGPLKVTVRRSCARRPPGRSRRTASA